MTDDAKRIKDFLDKLESLPINKDDQWLSPDELQAFRQIAAHRDEIVRFFEFRQSRRLVFETYRASLLAIAGLIGLFLTFKTHIVSFVGELATWFGK